MTDIPAGFKRIDGSTRHFTSGTHLIGPTDPDEQVSVTIYVRRRPDAPPLLDHDHWVKTPPAKRRFLSRQEFASQYGAAQTDIDKVTSYAASHGLKVEETSLAQCTVRLSGTARQMNNAFAVKLGNYESSKDKQRFRSPEGHVHVPEHLSEIVRSVLGLDNKRIGRHHNMNVPATASVLTPPWVAQLYQFPAVPAGIKNQTIAILEFGGGYSQADIDAYFGVGPHASWSPLAAPNTTNPTPGLPGPSAAAGTLVEVDIGNGRNGQASGEVTLDIVVAASVAPGAKIVVYFARQSGVDSMGGTFSTGADWAEAISTAVNDATNTPSVISISWGGAENNSNGWLLQDMQAVDPALQAAAMMGVAIFTSIGDFGSDDFVHDGMAHPDFPGASPWVTACGGTIISNVHGASFDEGTWNDGNLGGATGGGISQVYPLPSWQNNAGVPVSKNPGGTAGRGMPDIAGNASLFSGYNIVLHGQNPWPLPAASNGMQFANGGTSVVAPLYAGLAAILNAYLGTNAGFLNPTLYALNGTSVFRDINDGVSNDDPFATLPAPPTYTSGPGWDACTGLGSIHGAALLSALQAAQPAVSLILDRSTFGQDEVQTLTMPGSYNFNDAFYVVVTGFTPDELGLTSANLHMPPNVPSFAGAFAALGDPRIIFDSATGVQLEQPGNFFTIQHITFPYNIQFTTINAFSGLSAANPQKTYGLSAKIKNTIAPPNYVTITTPSSNTAEFELVFQADPFMTAGETWWLTNDLRVFQVTPATLPAGNVPLAYSSTAYTSDPNTYIQALVTELNTSFTDPSNMSTPFAGISADEDQSALRLTANDSSGNAVYNFALARVHLVGDVANNVRVFFRLFISSSPDTDFNTATTFRSVVETDANGNNIAGTLIPLLGFPTSDMPSTIPFFAEPRIDPTSEPMSRQTDPTNVQTIPSPLGPMPGPGNEAYAYFGCWLDLNQPTRRFPLNPSTQQKPDGPYASSVILSIPELIMSNHACLVAEISYDSAPIPAGANASTSDKIGQRNLSWAASDNPGPLDAHRIPTLFDLRHTGRNVPAAALPDELMIEWGSTPAGSTATIYWPQLNAEDVLKLARRFYASSNLRSADANTIECVTGNVTYIPIPSGTGPNLAGLLTIDLPLTVRVGQEFNIVVRRLTSARIQKTAGRGNDVVNWRYVVGAFQIKIPVRTGPELLASEESDLALFKWKLESLPPANRWYPVILRYLKQLAGRVNGFGGNAATVEPSQLGTVGITVGPGGAHGHPGLKEFTGKVSGVVYDRFGDFEGFYLLTEDGSERSFRSRESEIEELVRRAWEDRMVITVFVDRQENGVPAAIILRRMQHWHRE